MTKNTLDQIKAIEKEQSEPSVKWPHEHKWEYVSHWQVQKVVMVRRVCSCGKRQDAEITPKQWSESPNYELSTQAKREGIK